MEGLNATITLQLRENSLWLKPFLKVIIVVACMPGKFIVLEGVDAAGKSLMAKELASFLEKKGFSVFLTAEPSKSDFGQKVRALLRSEHDPQKNARTFLDLYVNDRKIHLEKEILPALKKGKIVLCDRYKYSTIVYQALQGIPVEKILSLHEKMLVPDLVLVLDVPLKVSLKRIEKSHRDGIDTFEQEKFLRQVRKKFLSLSSLLPKENIKVIGAAKPKKLVLAVLKKEVQSLL